MSVTENEAAKIVYTIKAFYPMQYANFTKQEIKNLILAWAWALEDYTYEQASSGLKVYLTGESKGFPPSPGQVIDCIHKPDRALFPEQTALEAFALVRTAVSRSTYYSEEEFAKLPPDVQKAVGNSANLREWAAMPVDQFETVEESQFIRVYNTLMQRKHEEQKIPKSALLEAASRKTMELEEQNEQKALMGA